LAAILDAFSDERNHDSPTRADDLLKGFLSSIFGALSHQKCTPMRAVRPKGSKSLCIVSDHSSATTTIELGTIVQRPTHLLLTSGILNIIREEIDFDDGFSKGSKIVQWETLPDWVVTTTRCVFSEIFEATEKIRQRQSNDENNHHHLLAGSDNNDATDMKRLDGSATTKEAYSHIFCVIATLLCFDSMGVREVSCSPLPMMCCPSDSLGDDTLMELLFGMALNSGVTINVDGGMRSASTLSTAIGISLLRVLTGVSGSQRSRITPIVLQKRGLGTDDKNTNLVSVVVGFEDGNSGSDGSRPSARISQPKTNAPKSPLFKTDCVAHFETNLDDMSGENLAFAIELLLQNGAIDAWIAPIVMKKGRPAHTLHCLCIDNECNGDNYNDDDDDNETINSLLELIFLHTSTLGVRIHRKIPRAKLERSISSVVTPFINSSRNGCVDVKVSRFKNGQIVRKKAEFDHCREISLEAGVGIQIVACEAIKAYDKQNNGDC